MKEIPQELLRTVAANVLRATDFSDLCARGLGAWPTAIADVLDVLGPLGGVVGTAAARLASNATSAPIYKPKHDVRLPLGHPLDSDFRFTAASAAKVLDRLITAAAPRGSILLVGLPTVALAAVDRGFEHRILYAMRQSDPVAHAIMRCAPRMRYVDLENLDGVAADCAAIDPPWYDDVAIPLIQRTSIGVRPGGMVLICGPDKFTNPSSATVMKAPSKHHPLLGVTSISLADRIRYETPLFEVRALAAAGLPGAGPRWRTGLIHAGRRATICPKPLPLPAQSDWAEVEVRGIRIWVRTAGDYSMQAASEASVSVVQTVSRTEPLRTQAMLWTSGNTVAVGIPAAEVFEYLQKGIAWPEIQSCSWLFSISHALRLDEQSATEMLEWTFPAKFDANRGEPEKMYAPAQRI